MIQKPNIKFTNALVIGLSRVVHITFIIYVTWYIHAMVHHIAYARETLHFMGVSAWLKSITTLGD